MLSFFGKNLSGFLITIFIQTTLLISAKFRMNRKIIELTPQFKNISLLDVESDGNQNPIKPEKFEGKIEFKTFILYPKREYIKKIALFKAEKGREKSMF